MKQTKKNERGLTPREQIFADAYLAEPNALLAYKTAGYKVKNDNVAGVMGFRLLKKTKISTYIGKRRKELEAKYAVTQEKVIRELALCAFANMQDYSKFGEGGVTLKDSKDLTRDQLAAVSEVSETTTKNGGSIKFRLHDKRGSLELLAKYLGLFSETRPFDGVINIVIGQNGESRILGQEVTIGKRNGHQSAVN